MGKGGTTVVPMLPAAAPASAANAHSNSNNEPLSARSRHSSTDKDNRRSSWVGPKTSLSARGSAGSGGGAAVGAGAGAGAGVGLGAAAAAAPPRLRTNSIGSAGAAKRIPLLARLTQERRSASVRSNLVSPRGSGKRIAAGVSAGGSLTARAPARLSRAASEHAARRSSAASGMMNFLTADPAHMQRQHPRASASGDPDEEAKQLALNMAFKRRLAAANNVAAPDVRSFVKHAITAAPYSTYSMMGSDVVRDTPERPKVCGVKRGSEVTYESVLQFGDFERLRTAAAWLATPYSPSSHTHEHKLSQLYALRFPTRQFKAATKEEWAILGFSGQDPRQDFRGGGIASLDIMLFCAVYYPVLFRKLTGALPATHRKRAQTLGFAIGCINVTHTLRQFFRLEGVHKHEWTAAGETTGTTVTCKDGAMKHFAWWFAGNAFAIQELVCATLEWAMRRWTAYVAAHPGCTLMEFNCVILRQLPKRWASLFRKELLSVSQAAKFFAKAK